MNTISRWGLTACALLAACTAWGQGPATAAATAANAAAERPSPSNLRHAVVCPPFSGEEPAAHVYRDLIAGLLQADPRVEYLDGAAATAKRAPQFTYHVRGDVKDGVLRLALVDVSRREVIATHATPVTADPQKLAAWGERFRQDVARRVARMPFECRVEAQAGQESLTLDRGLGSGLEPRMVLYVSGPEEELLDPRTGETVGRDAPRAYGQIVVFRVNARTAYARPLPGTVLPRSGELIARSF